MKYAEFWKRFAAYLFDWIVIGVVVVLLMFISTGIFESKEGFIIGPFIILTLNPLAVILYYTLMRVQHIKELWRS